MFPTAAIVRDSSTSRQKHPRTTKHTRENVKIRAVVDGLRENVQVLTRRDVAENLSPCTSVVFATYDRPPPDFSRFIKKAERWDGWIPFPLLMREMLQTLLDRCDHVMGNVELLQKVEVGIRLWNSSRHASCQLHSCRTSRNVVNSIAYAMNCAAVVLLG